MDRTLSGGQVQRLALGRVGAREVTLLQVRVPGETVYVLVASGRGVGLIDAVAREPLREAMRGTAPPYQAHWRSRIEGARLTYAVEGEVGFNRDGVHFRAASADSNTLTMTPSPADAPKESLGWDALLVSGARIAQEILRADAGGRQNALRRAVAKALGRIERRIEAVRRDLSKMESAEQEGRRAQLFVAEAAHAPRGAKSLYALDWSSGTPQTVELKLDAAKSAKEQLAATFKRAKRMKEGVVIASARLNDAETACDELRDVARALMDAEPDSDALEARARAIAPRDFKLGSGPAQTPGSSRQDGPRPPYRKFTGASGLAILVGRGALHNDALTMRVARSHDLWLHAKGRTGAHVVVPLNKGASCPPDLLVEAAHLAAHFSEAREERIVEVLYTPRRYIRKPRASAAGAVTVDREKVIVLRKNDDILRGLLASESAT